MIRRILVIWSFMVSSMACKHTWEESTPNAIAQDAQIAFDDGNYQRVIEIMNRLDAAQISADPDLSLLASYANLALAGINPYQVYEVFIKNDNGQNKKNTIDYQKLSQLISLNPDDYDLMVAPENKRIRENVEISGLSTFSMFADLPLHLPKKVENLRANSSKSLALIDRAIRYACPYLPYAVKILENTNQKSFDSRHQSIPCNTYIPSSHTIKFQYIWLVAHLAEGALFFEFFEKNSPKIEERLSRLESRKSQFTEPKEIIEYFNHLKEITRVLSTFYSVDGIESREALTTAIVNDFVTASETFRQVMGVSPEFTGRIPYILELIKTASNLEGESILSASTAELRRSVVNALKDMYKIDSFTELDANLLCFDFKLLFNNNHTICVEELR